MDPANYSPDFWARAQAQLAASDKLSAMYVRAYAAYPAWLAYLKSDQRTIAQETLMLCERLPEMARAIFAAGYVAAMVDELPVPATPHPSEAR